MKSDMSDHGEESSLLHEITLKGLAQFIVEDTRT